MRSIQFSPSLKSSSRNSRSKTKSSEFKLPTSEPHTSAERRPSTEPLPSIEPLPPLVRVQGPFKPPEELRKLKTKPFNPTLRVQTSYNCQDIKRYVWSDTKVLSKDSCYNSLCVCVYRIELRKEEWRKRVIDDEFLPFTQRPPTPCGPLLHTNSRYRGLTHVQFPTEQFRKSHTEKHISTQPFSALWKPQSTFDDLIAPAL